MRLIIAVLSLGLPLLGLADTHLDNNLDSNLSVPEPETLGLIAGAAIAWAIVRWRKRK
jgi:hypothetical protein